MSNKKTEQPLDNNLAERLRGINVFAAPKICREAADRIEQLEATLEGAREAAAAWCKEFRNAVDKRVHMELEIERLIAEVRNARNAGWISVKTEPEEYGHYLCAIVGNSVVRERYFGHPNGETKTGWYADQDGGNTMQPTHWMEKPEAPTAAPIATTKSGESEVKSDVFAIDDNVVVFDAYRMAIPVTGRVSKLSSTNDGVAVVLTSTNNSSYPVGTEIWVSAKQLRESHDR